MELDRNKVLIGMSGGVDSSAAALLLKNQGYDVTGVTLKLMQSDSEINDAAAVCEKLGIKHIVCDFSNLFCDEIINNFTDEYKNARTPNPCVLCNKKIKWGAMLQLADEMGAYYIATGHYAKIICTGGMYSLEASENGKDQTYALYMLGQEELSRTLMPLGNYTKTEIRQLAADAGLPTASKSDSQDICFVPDGDYAAFLEAKGVCAGPGNFINKDGKVFGKHKGITHYTVGQRRGLGIAADRSLYVLKIDPVTNNILLGYEEETFGKELNCKCVNWIGNKPEKEIELKVKIRYNHVGAMAKVTASDDGSAHVVFSDPVKAITPGQSAVFYDGLKVIGGGIIK